MVFVTLGRRIPCLPLVCGHDDIEEEEEDSDVLSLKEKKASVLDILKTAMS